MRGGGGRREIPSLLMLCLTAFWSSQWVFFPGIQFVGAGVAGIRSKDFLPIARLCYSDVMNEVPDPEKPSRRELLNGRRRDATRDEKLFTSKDSPPAGSSTMRLSARAMACDFSVILNPGNSAAVETAGAGLEMIAAVEGWLSPYRTSSELSRVNREAAATPCQVRGDFFELLQLAEQLWKATDGHFDFASGALGAVWRAARKEGEIPQKEAIQRALDISGFQHVGLNAETLEVSLLKPGVCLDPGAIGKGFALDQVADWLEQQDSFPKSFLLHGGHSSLLASGTHAGHLGWPVGLGNPLLTEKRMATVLLNGQALATSGSNIQFFRHQGRRMGHILDPRTGWPVDGVLSVTVLAASAATADALSTAFFAMGIEKAVECCQRMADIAAILVPFPERGVRLRPVVVGGSQIEIWWDDQQVEVDYSDVGL